jgi:two-component sensor histidine kinase
MLQQLNERQASTLAHTAGTDDRAKTASDASLVPFVFMKSRLREKEGDFLDRLARRVEIIRPFSASAVAVAVAAVAVATLLRWLSGSTPLDPRFGVYIVAIMATGLLASVPAAIGAAVTSIVIVFFAFVPPYFSLKWPGTTDQINLALATLASLVTIYFTYCCRVVLRRLSHREITNQILVNELEHRGRNMFSINEVIVRKSLDDEPQRAETIIQRFRAIQEANTLLTGARAHPVTLREILSIELAAYDEERLAAAGPEFEVAPEAVRHLLLLFHELVTNAAKYGALSSSTGRIKVQWKWAAGGRIILTWTESGGPKVVPPTRNGFGSQLIGICVQALDGTIEKSFDRDGLRCKIAARVR